MDATRTTARTPEAADKSTAQLTADLVRQVGALVDDEITLAKSEMAEKGKRAGIGAGMFGGAGFLGAVALLCFSTAAIAGIAVALPVWAAALIVGGAYLVIAGMVAIIGRRELEQATPPVPNETIQHAKEDVEWIKTQATSETR